MKTIEQIRKERLKQALEGSVCGICKKIIRDDVLLIDFGFYFHLNCVTEENLLTLLSDSIYELAKKSDEIGTGWACKPEGYDERREVNGTNGRK